jgi:hypothetical protein
MENITRTWQGIVLRKISMDALSVNNDSRALTVAPLLIARHIKKTSGHVFLALIMLPLLMFSNISYAETQRFIDYEYDGAGNIIAIRSSRNLGPPDVTELSPAFIHKESFASIEATGVNLAKASVSFNAPGITLIDIKNISDTEVALRFYADATAAIGDVPVTFTTRLGSDTENMTVAERTPVVSTEPNPILLSPEEQNVTVRLTFDRPYETEQTFDVAVTDEAIATVAEQQVTLQPSESEVSVTISAVSAGTTTFEINQLSNFLALGIPVLVIDEPLPDGTYGAYTKPVGVAAYIPQPASTNGPFVTQAVGVGAYIPAPASTNGPFVTAPVGVGAYIPAPSSTNGPFVTPPVGVGAYIPAPASTNGPFVTAPVGVGAYIPPPSSTNGPFLTNIVGSTYGTAVDSVSPASVVRGTSVTLTVTGYDLTNVTEVAFLPSDGITQTGALSALADGSELTIDITIDGATPTGERYIRFTDQAGNHVYSNGVFQITN